MRFIKLFIISILCVIVANAQDMKKPELAQLINQLAKLDQEPFQRALKGEIDSKTAEIESHKIYRENYLHLKKIIKDNGYPSYAMVGEVATNNFNLMVLHCFFDVGFQRKILQLFEKESQKDKSLISNKKYLRDLAFLTDKVNINSNKQQIYGTQIERGKDGYYQIKPTVEPTKLNQRRAKMQLEPIEEYLKRANALVDEERKKLEKSENDVFIIRANSNKISIQDGAEFFQDAWTLIPENPESKFKTYQTTVPEGKTKKVSFITDLDSISFEVKPEKDYKFKIEQGGKTFNIQIIGTKFIPAAVFDENYQKTRQGKTFIQIPEVYELVNIAIAMTPTGNSDKGLVFQKSDYYQKVRAWFDKHQNHPLIAAFDEQLKYGQYFNLKMNGYSFEFDNTGKIVRSRVFDRTGWGNSNVLLPFLEKLQSFAEATNFRQFYQENKPTYDEQIAFFRDTADIAEMKRWLDKNFPTSNDYNTYNIIFSPLVSSNQSVNRFESNGFKELQPHVNFPYSESFQSLGVSEKSIIFFRGTIVFTEINHGYINPEADKYADKITKAISNRSLWVDKRMESSYPGILAFNEYLNWGLINLRFVDYVPLNEQEKLIKQIEQVMYRRGFLQFPNFNEFLVALYRNRKPNQTIANLYPQIIEWFEKNNSNSSEKKI